MQKLNTGFLLALAATALAGCTTLNDFIAMTPQERAITVCDNADSLKNLAKSCSTYAETEAKIQGNLARGYSIYHRCEWIEIQDGMESDCWTDKRGHSHCEHRPRYRQIQQCHDIPMTFNPEEEQKRLEDARAAADTCRQQFSESKVACLKRVMTMLPQDAYAHYDKNTAP